MSKRFRFLLTIAAIVICGAFLFPSFKWYFVTSKDDKELASGSRQQIRDYALKKAAAELKELLSLTKQGETSLPEQFAYLIPMARENYKLNKESLPKEWTVQKVLGSFATEKELLDSIEKHHRNQILQLKEKGQGILQLGLDLSGGLSVLLEADMDSLGDRLGHAPTVEDKKQAIDGAMEILNNRIDKFGVTEPQIRRQGTDQIAIEVPGAADPERIQSFLMGKGRLNFHIGDDDATARMQDYIKSNPTDFAETLESGGTFDFLQAGESVLGFYKKDSYGIDQRVRYIVVHDEIGLDGNHIKDAQIGNDTITGKPVINFILDKEGGDIFFKLTSANVDKTLAIVLDGKVKAGARISEPIRDQVRMTGFDLKEANNLALILRTAAMPVDLNVLNQQAIGASLGEDSIRTGINAITLGMLLVIVFMFLYYLGAGIVADVALLLNLFFTVAILSAFGLTLTLTSIAGIILTVGMAVDANVIIFERIKEELRLGKSADAALKAGFKKAFWTIMDSNITTFIAAIFLSQLASGPIQGFAVTLAIGIVSSMFTALFIARLIFDFRTETMKAKKLSISWRIK